MVEIKFSKQELDVLFELNLEKDSVSLFDTGFGTYAISVEVIKLKTSLFICTSTEINQKASLVHKYELKEDGLNYVLIHNDNVNPHFNTLMDIENFIDKCEGDYFLDNTIKNDIFDTTFGLYYLEKNNIPLKAYI